MENVPNSSITLPFLTEVTAATIFTIIFAVCCVLFIAHWLVASYHWYTFGSERRISILSATVYGAGGALVLLIMGAILVTM